MVGVAAGIDHIVVIVIAVIAMLFLLLINLLMYDFFDQFQYYNQNVIYKVVLGTNENVCSNS